jgi:arsenite methyltransferase
MGTHNRNRMRSILKVVSVFLITLVPAHIAGQPFEERARDEWQKPDQVVSAMGLKPGDAVADIGAGNGYFTMRFAKAVDPGGIAFGLEISDSKVRYMQEEAERLGLDNVEARKVETDDPGMEPGSLDVIFLCNAYHHLDNRVEYFHKAAKYLKKDGRVVIVDFYKRDMPVGPRSASHKLSREVVLEEFQEAGYRLQKERGLLPYQYFLEFTL